MSLAAPLVEYIAACFTGLWIESHEHDDALAEIAQLCHRETWRLAVWDVDQGLKFFGKEVDTTAASVTDPLAAIRSLRSLAAAESSTLLVLVNFHRFLGSAEIVQALARQISLGKQTRTFIVVLAPVVQLPAELEKQFVVLEHPRPSHEQLAEIARGIATQADELPSDDELSQVLEAAAGLTRYEAEGAFSLSLVRHGRITPEVIWEMKSQLLKKTGLMSLYRGPARFDDLGGLAALKDFCLRALRRQSHQRSSAATARRVAPGCPRHGKIPVRQGAGERNGPADACRSISAVSWVLWWVKPSNKPARHCRSPTPWRRAFCLSMKSKKP